MEKMREGMASLHVKEGSTTPGQFGAIALLGQRDCDEREVPGVVSSRHPRDRSGKVSKIERIAAKDDPSEMSSRILVTDFDGTITRHDFFTCVVETLLTPDDLAPWHLYTAGGITHFEALRRIFARIRAHEAELDAVLRSMDIDPGLQGAFARLQGAGWDVIIVSNGCSWYIDRLLHAAGVAPTVLTNPGRFDPERGLIMELPASSPFFSPETGIDKRAVVEKHLRSGAVVAFAGDGRPDVAPALLVPPERRFARAWLAEHLEATGHRFRAFDRWSEIARILVATEGEVQP
jgi:2-hydroxy-3-keto-5-methylthiopentenyl-1-phosphate phosphatase